MFRRDQLMPRRRTTRVPSRHRVLTHLPAGLELSGSTAFRCTRHMLVPQKPGVYLLHDLRGVLYVGKTRNLYRRFDQHYWLTDNELLALAMRRPFGELAFSWILVDGDNERTDLERRVIAWL